METRVLYGQVQYFFRAVLPVSRSLKTKEEHQELLAIVQWCRDAEGDATKSRIWYESMGVFQAVNVATIQCPVGRVQVGNQWGILDISYECARTSFVEEEDNCSNGE